MTERAADRRQAILPEDMEEPTIASMLPGETAYTVPWAMWADPDRRLWLHPEYRIHDEPGGTVRMQLMRLPEGFRVWAVGDHGYRTDGGGYAGGTPEGLPVVDLVR